VRSIASRWGPVISRALGWLLIIAWLALATAPSPPPPFRIWCGRDYRGGVSAPNNTGHHLASGR